MPFDAGDASGWDECLPSVAACSVYHSTQALPKFPTTVTSGASRGSRRGDARTPSTTAGVLFAPARARAHAQPCRDSAKAVSSTSTYKLTNTGGYRSMVLGGAPALRR